MTEKTAMLPRAIGRGERASYPTYSTCTTRIEWVGHDENGAEIVRTPEPREHTYLEITGFFAAGQRYANLAMIGAGNAAAGPVRRDAFGREVLCRSECFPCFDSDDYLHENRYYRWFFIKEGDKLTRVYHGDGDKQIVVTEDVRDVEDECWERMKETGFLKEA